MIYTGQSGSPINYTYNGDINGDGANGNDLIFIPTDAQIDAMPFSGNNVDEQKANLKAWLASTPYLKDHRGEHYKRNSYNLPFEHHFDFHFAQDFKFKVAQRYHTLQLSFDVMNIGNMLNPKWGIENFMSNNSDSPIRYSNGAYSFTNSVDYDPVTISDFNSRWRAQVGLKYIF